MAISLYFSVWFCAIIFYDNTALNIESPVNVGYKLAIIKALVLSKFMLAGQEFFPLRFIKKSSLILVVTYRTFLYTLVVLFFSYLFKGIEGLLHHQEFLDSVRSFEAGNLNHVLAMTLLYALIVFPYVTYVSVVEAIGLEKLRSYLY